MKDDDFLKDISALAGLGITLFTLIIIASCYCLIDFFFIPDKMTSKHKVIPNLEIKTVIRNKTIVNDTTYIYTFN